MPNPARYRIVVLRSLSSFTLIELLVVMAIIAILASLILYAGNAVIIKGQRSRAAAEIQAMSTALEGYKTDNGIYPPTTALTLTTNNYATTDPNGAAGAYQQSSQILYQALSGQTNFLDTTVVGKAYMSFKANQLGNATAATGTTAPNSTYVQDPFRTSYAYSTGTSTGGGTTNFPYNGNGFFDLWSTGGITLAKETANASLTNAWISNWQ
jgi:prepilin-type N-terminal cleavage/methylation domain-containing protein